MKQTVILKYCMGGGNVQKGPDLEEPFYALPVWILFLRQEKSSDGF